MTDLHEEVVEAAVVGAGPAGLMAAERLLAAGYQVTIFDRMPTPGRKLLLAGRGGLNLTHSEPQAVFNGRYGAAAERLAPLLERFGPAALRAWCDSLGMPTFVGSSGRVFPQSFKTSPLLRAWLRRLDAAGARWRLRHDWRGFLADDRLRFATLDGDVAVKAKVTILALGGASWPQLGSDGRWTPILTERGVGVTPLAPANCGFLVDWSAPFRERFEGEPLKGIALSFDGENQRGDLVVTRAGLEGGPLYALAPPLRCALVAGAPVTLALDLRPDLTPARIVERLASRPAKESMSTRLRKALALAPVAIGLIQETARRDGQNPADLTPEALAAWIKAVPLSLVAPMSLDRAISTAGGVRWAELDETLMLRPSLFVAGEMIDWEAPTGGYLLQACFATGAAAGQGASAWLDARR